MPVERRSTVERAWRAMGCEVSVVVVEGPPELADQAVERVADLERRWSRFLPDSEISALNRAAGTPVAVTADTRLLVETSIEAWRATDGAFDPLVGDAVIAAGYDRTIAEVRARDEVAAGRPMIGPNPGAIAIDPVSGTVRLPIGGRFDPGALGKGLAADLVASELVAAGAAGACVNLGGDVRVCGVAPERLDGADLGWHVGVADPFAPDRDAVVATLADGAVATSSTLERRWRLVGGGEAHHLIDPRTGEPSRSSVVTATVIAANGATAEALATAAIIAGADVAPTMIEGLGAAALLVEADGRRTIVGAFEAFLVEPMPLDAGVSAGRSTV